MDIGEKLKDFVSLFKVPKESITKAIALVFIYVIGLMLRLYPIIQYGVDHKAYDPFIQYLATKILIKEGLVAMLSYYDYKFWYPYGNGLASLYIMVPILGAIIYYTLNALGFNVDVLTAITLAPAIYGSFAIIVVYFIGREIKNSNVGLVAALITAISPGFLQRSTAGFYDNEMTILFVLLAILFFLRALKTGSMSSAILSGFLTGIEFWSWGIWRYLVGILAIYAFLRLVSRTIDYNDKVAYVTTILIGTGIGVMIPRNYGEITSVIVVAAVGVAALIILDDLATYFSKLFGKTRTEMYKIMIGTGLVLTLVGVLALLSMGYLKSLTGKFASILNPFLREEIVAYTSVAENQPSVWANFYLGVGLGVLFIPLGILAMMERREKVDVFYVILVLTSFYFTASITRYIVLAAPLFAIAVGLGVDYLLEPYTRFFTKRYVLHKSRVVRVFLGEKRLPRGEAAATYFVVFLVLSITMIQGISIAKYYGGYDYTTGEKNVFRYLSTYAEPTDVVLSWWDYGYRCTIMGNVSTLADNGTGNSTQMGVVGSMLMLPPNVSIVLMRKYRVKWILVYSYDVPKAIWMIKIASKYAPEYGINESLWLNGEERRYKMPFFESVLWNLVVYGESKYNIQKLIETYGETSIKKKAGDLADRYSNIDLVYFQLVMKESVGGNDYVKLYKVIWPEDISNTAPFPSAFNETLFFNITNRIS